MPRRRSDVPTPAQKELLAFIYSFTEEHCYQPSLDEMAGQFRVTKEAVLDRLRGLRERGMLSFAERPSSRALVLHFVKCRLYRTNGGEPAG